MKIQKIALDLWWLWWWINGNITQRQGSDWKSQWNGNTGDEQIAWVCV